jgi:hypothetical protein
MREPARKNEVSTSEVALYLAGQLGQASLLRLGRVAHPVLDQHMAAVAEDMVPIVGTGKVPPAAMLTALVRYASGFIDAAISGGWRPAPADQPLDPECMRLAAISALVERCGASLDGS